MEAESNNVRAYSFSFWSAITNRKHDVFLSFRGEDTRRNITQRLHDALVEAGIPTFKDDINLEKGCDIASDLLKSIQMSTIAVIIFSRNYATSGWCLDELAKIVECKREDGQVVLPIFYDVDPSDVVQQKGSFDKAMKEHEKRLENQVGAESKLERWREALTVAGSQSGFDLKDCAAAWDQSKFIDEIVKEITSRRQDAHMGVSIYPTGTDESTDYLNMLLSIVSNDVLVIGISGMNKTNIATTVYNENFHRFEASCFLKNVKGIAKQPNGLLVLQKKFISEILMKSDDLVEIETVKMGIDVIKKEMSSRRVLLVLDNVNSVEQLNALARKRKWFGPGSRILVTTSDEELLNVLEVDHVYGDRGIQVIEDKYKDNLQMIGGLLDFIHKSHAEADERVGSLLTEIENERRKSAFQKQVAGSLEQNSADALALTNEFEVAEGEELQEIQVIKDQFRQHRKIVEGLSEMMRSHVIPGTGLNPVEEMIKQISALPLCNNDSVGSRLLDESEMDSRRVV